MNLSKETLNKTEELLNTGIEQLEIEENEILTKLHENKFENFTVHYIDNRWFGEDKRSYEVTFKHVTEQVDFKLSTKKEVSSISWSSWSYSHIKPEELQGHLTASMNYLGAVTEMLVIMKDTTEAMKVVAKVSKVFENQVKPLRDKRYGLQNELTSVKKVIADIDSKESLVKAQELFKETVFLNQSYQLNSKTYLSEIKIEQDKKDNNFIMLYGRKRKIDDYTLEQLYKLATHMQTSIKTDYDKEYDTEGYRLYYKYSNMYSTMQKAYKPVQTQIDKKEYDEIRNNRY